MKRRNPYPTHAGFGFRVADAKRALRRLGEDCTASIFTLGFDNCFEMNDGNAVVWALMRSVHGGDALLERGIRYAGDGMWCEWCVIWQTPDSLCHAPGMDPERIALNQTSAAPYALRPPGPVGSVVVDA